MTALERENTSDPQQRGTTPPRDGLIEAHAHIASFGQSLGMTDLAACRSVHECLELVRSEAGRPGAATDLSSASPGWVRMFGARIEGWTEQRWPTLAELDAAAGDTPCVIMSFDHHAAVANTAAMSAAGLKPGAAVPPSGVVYADPLGRPTGLLLEHAAYAAWYAAPEPSPERREAHVLAALGRLSELGFVEVHDMLSEPWLGPLLGELDRAGRLPMRVWLYPRIDQVEDAAACTRGPRGWQTDRVRLAGGKVFADGTLNSRTALMLSDYRDPLPELPRGRAMVSANDLDDAITLTTGLGVGLAVHAIGDGAVRMVLDAWERTGPRGLETSRTPNRSHPPRLRIEHCELINERDVPRFAAMGVVCSVQPCHLLADVEALTRYLPHCLDRVLPLRDLIDSGCRPGELLWFGSDVPIVRPDPADSVHAAVHRRRPDAPEGAAIGWSQGIAATEAEAAFRRPA